MMTAYGTLANEGYKNTPYLIEKIEDINGNILYEHKKAPENVLNKSITFVLNNMLNNCYSQEFIDYTYPTCMSISPKLTKKYAIKTGTTNTDHLIFGYNKDILVGVWTGYDNNKTITSSDGLINKNVWADIVENYLKDKETSWYSAPKNVVGVLIEPVSGNLANENSKKKKLTYYIKGTEPYIENNDLDDLIPTVKEENNQ
jgi:membrane carboxypeptidase/penicillin-binding protein